MEKKYELLKDDTIEINGKTLYRIRALKDFGGDETEGVEKGNIGGYIESEKNLSHEGECWVAHNAKVYDEAKVYENAYIIGKAEIYENAEIYGNSMIHGCAKVHGKAHIHDNVDILDNAEICGDVKLGNDITIGSIALITSENDYSFIHYGGIFGSVGISTITFYRLKDGKIGVDDAYRTPNIPIEKFVHQIAHVYQEHYKSEEEDDYDDYLFL